MESTIIKKQQSNSLLKEKVYKPSLQQLIWLDTDIRLGSDNISEIERESKVTAQSYYNWVKNPEFVKWYGEEWDRRIKSKKSLLDNIGFKMAKRDYRYFELMQKRVGNIKDPSENLGMSFNDGERELKVILTRGE